MTVQYTSPSISHKYFWSFFQIGILFYFYWYIATGEHVYWKWYHVCFWTSAQMCHYNYDRYIGTSYTTTKCSNRKTYWLCGLVDLTWYSLENNIFGKGWNEMCMRSLSGTNAQEDQLKKGTTTSLHIPILYTHMMNLYYESVSRTQTRTDFSQNMVNSPSTMQITQLTYIHIL